MERMSGWKLVPLISGILFAFLGILTMIFPNQILSFLPICLGIILMIAGVIEIVDGTRYRTYKHAANMDILQGVLSILLGIIFLLKRNFTIVFITIFIGLWALISGVIKITTSFSMSRENQPWGWILADGIIQTLLGMLILFEPFGGAVALTIVAGFYMLYLGISIFVIGIYVDRRFDL